MPIALSTVDPEFSSELRQLLTAAGEDALAAQVASLDVVDRCRCGEAQCATFYTQPKPAGAYGPGLRSVQLSPNLGMLILDVVEERIACVEVLDDDRFRRRLLLACP